jgi:ankyrin repeat protein
MKHLLLTTIAAVVLVGCGLSERALFDAAEVGNIEAVKQHLASGMDVNVKNEAGVTPLHVAALMGHKEIAELLIAKGADVNETDSDGKTPLLSAAYFGRKEIAELLIAEGADVNAKTTDGETPLDWALVFAAIELNIGEDQNPFLQGKPRKHAETVALLRKHGGKATERPVDESDLIHDAVTDGNIEAVKQYLADGTDVDARNVLKMTPLHSAAESDQKEIAELLITEGADVNAKNIAGSTPLDFDFGFDNEIADILRKHGGKTGEELKAERK